MHVDTARHSTPRGCRVWVLSIDSFWKTLSLQDDTLAEAGFGTNLYVEQPCIMMPSSDDLADLRLGSGQDK